MDSIDSILTAFAQGEMVIVLDDEGRENEGDLMLAAEFATPQAINLMAHLARSILVVAIAPSIAERFELAPMVPTNNAKHGTNFTVSVDAAAGGTGVSAFDRALTISTFTNPAAGPGDLLRPGHMFPITAHKDGLRGRQGHTEAAVALAEQAGLQPAVAMLEILNQDGSLARRPQLEILAREHQLKMGTVTDLQTYVAQSAAQSDNLKERSL